MSAAQQGAMRTYLHDAIGIGDPVARRQAIQDEGLNLITDFTEFEKEDEQRVSMSSFSEFEKEDIETLCSSV